MPRNKFEDRVAATLGPEWEYEAVKLSYTIAHTYLPDWVCQTTKRIKEAKGHFPACDRAKMKAVAKQNPDWSIEIVFQNPNTKISKKSKTTYAGWCEKNGIAWRAA